MKSGCLKKLCALVIAATLAATSCSKPASGGNASQASGAQSGQRGGPGGTGGRQAAVIPVQAIAVQIGNLSTDRTSAGVVTPAVQSQVASQVAGIVLKVPAHIGDWVKEGSPVVQLDDTQLRLSLSIAQAALDNANINLAMGQDNSSQANPKLRLQLQSAQSALDSAQKNYDGQKALYDLGGISASALDTAKSQLTAAQANLEGAKTALDQNDKADDWSTAQLKIAVTQAQNQVDQAKLNLRNASIKAPFSGQIAAINMQPGMYVGLNTPVFTLVNSARQINFNIPPSDVAFLKLGTPLKFSYTGQDYPIKVVQIPSAPMSGVIPIVASSGQLAALSFGTVGNVVYHVTLSRGALVPLASLATLESHNYVFAVQNGRAVVKDVSIIAEAGTTAAVEGLQAGDVVIVSPPPGLLQGSLIQPTMMQGGPGAQAANAAAPNASRKKGSSQAVPQAATP